ncbi:MAG: segregation/condensation protein A [Syntrophomonadaceae bacterium]|nr:segregation/condensation protein A [Syntrophomonadaceae bacterium]
MPYVVALEAFHGPLDLLLYLIEENQLDIYDIPIAAITDQYLAYLADTGDWDLDRLGDFMVMASYLLQLKSRMLLPRRHLPQYEPEENTADPREELVQKLLSYKRFRQVAQYLARLEQGEVERVYYRQAYDIKAEEELVADIKSLVSAYKALREQMKASQTHVEIPSGDVDIELKMSQLMAILRQKKRKGMAFGELLKTAANRKDLLGYFLALLELLRQHRVRAVQPHHKSEIMIYLWAGTNHVDA